MHNIVKNKIPRINTAVEHEIPLLNVQSLRTKTELLELKIPL